MIKIGNMHINREDIVGIYEKRNGASDSFSIRIFLKGSLELSVKINSENDPEVAARIFLQGMESIEIDEGIYRFNDKSGFSIWDY